MHSAVAIEDQRGRRARQNILYTLLVLASAGLITASWQAWLELPLDRTEVLAFVSGAWAVWLTARNNIWNWPIGILNSAFFVVLFWNARLYFDMGINVFYVVSGIVGWITWAFGGPRLTSKPITRIRRRELWGVTLVGVVATVAMWQSGIFIDDAAPFLDAITTALSMVAQWLLMRRVFEHWYGWIAADVLYVPLYLSKGLPLTGVLYTAFLLMCLRGLAVWRSEMRAAR